MHQKNRAFAGHAHMEKTVGYMVVISHIDRLMVEETDHDDGKGVENRDGEDEQRDQDREARFRNQRIEISDFCADDRQHVAEEMTAAVSHEN